MVGRLQLISSRQRHGGPRKHRAACTTMTPTCTAAAGTHYCKSHAFMDSVTHTTLRLQQAGLDQRRQATTTPGFAPGWVPVTSSTTVQPSEDTATHAWKEAESYLAAPTRTTDAQAAQVAGTAAEQHQAAPHWSASRRGVVLQGASPHTTSSRRHSRVRAPLVGQPGTSCRRAPEPGSAACAVNMGVEWHSPINRMGVRHS